MLLAAPRALLRYLRALPTIHVHPELDGRTLDIVHSLIKGGLQTTDLGQNEDCRRKQAYRRDIQANPSDIQATRLIFRLTGALFRL